MRAAYFARRETRRAHLAYSQAESYVLLIRWQSPVKEMTQLAL